MEQQTTDGEGGRQLSTLTGSFTDVKHNPWMGWDGERKAFPLVLS
jgi:hypothetical protein